MSRAKNPQPPPGYIFQDSLPLGAAFYDGDALSIVTAHAFAGSTSLQIQGQSTWENYRIVNLNVPVNTVVWADSSLEFALKSPIAADYVSISLWGDGVQAPEQSLTLVGNGVYQTFRFNLSDFATSQSAFGKAITTFMISGNFGSGSLVYLDEVRVTTAGTPLTRPHEKARTD